MDRTIIANLRAIGLNNNEIKVYIAALPLGETSIAALANQSGVHRVATYPIVETLVQKGLLTKTASGKKNTVKATNPRQILDLLNREKRKLRKLELKYQEFLPELQAIYRSSTEKPHVRLYEGTKEIQAMGDAMFDYVQHGDEIYSYANIDALENILEAANSKNPESDVSKRIEFEIVNHVIVPDSPLVRERTLPIHQEMLLDIVVVPTEAFPYNNDITLYNGVIAIQALEPQLVGVLIESQELYNDQKAIFQLAWEGAKAIGEYFPYKPE